MYVKNPKHKITGLNVSINLLHNNAHGFTNWFRNAFSFLEKQLFLLVPWPAYLFLIGFKFTFHTKICIGQGTLFGNFSVLPIFYAVM